MNWKLKKYKLNEEEVEPTPPQLTPIIINNDQVVSSGLIRVVDNKIFFYEDITDNSILELNRLLVEVDNKLQSTKIIIGEEFDPIIHLHLKTYGGEIFAALTTVDLIPNLKSKVYTYVDGAVASAGTLISIVGAKRFMGKHASLLIHQLSGGVYGRFADIEDEFTNCTYLMKLLKALYKEHTKLPMKKLEEVMKHDLWWSTDECIQYGIVDSLY